MSMEVAPTHRRFVRRALSSSTAWSFTAWSAAAVIAVMGTVLCGARATAAEPCAERPDPCAQPACEQPACTAPCACPPVEHEFWMIDARCAPVCGCLDSSVDRLKYYRMEGCSWKSVDAAEFTAGQTPDGFTCFAVHGNRADRELAADYGRRAYQRLTESAPCGCKLRLVLWSWPSERVYITPRNDVREKESRSDAQAFYLATVVDRLDPTTPVRFLGYSHGVRAIGGALQILAGGRMAGRTLVDRAETPRMVPMRAVLMAGAVDSNWFWPNMPHGLALSQLDKVLVMYSTADPVLRLYPLLDRPRLPEAQGYVGVASPGRLGEERLKLEQFNASRWVDDHDFREYLGSRTLARRMAPFIFGECPATPSGNDPTTNDPGANDPAPDSPTASPGDLPLLSVPD